MIGQKLGPELKKTMSAYLFYKVIRVLSLLPKKSNRLVHEERKLCIKISKKLFDDEPQYCLGMGLITFTHLENIEEDPDIAPFI